MDFESLRQRYADHFDYRAKRTPDFASTANFLDEIEGQACISLECENVWFDARPDDFIWCDIFTQAEFCYLMTFVPTQG